MSFLITDEGSRRACAVTRASLLSYDGGSDMTGSLVAALEKEPNQIQSQFAEEQLLLAFWDVGLLCYGIATGDIQWVCEDLLRVERIVYSPVSGTYYVKPEDEWVTIALNRSGEIIERERALTVNAAFNGGRLLLMTSPSGEWCVKSSIGEAPIVRGNDQLKTPVQTVAGSNSIVAIAAMGGNIDIACLHTGRRLFSVQRQNWFGVSSVIQLDETFKFRALVSDWDGKPMGAVIEIDAKRQVHSFVAASRDWNWDSRLLNHGESVMRFFADKQDHFVVTDL